MTEVRTKRGVRLLPLAVDSVLLAGLLLATVGSPGAPVSPEFRSDATPHSFSNASAANLMIDPPSYEMRTGSNLTLQAVWSAGSPLCPVEPLWYHWSVDSGNATGFLNTTTGPSATFIADSFGSGTVTVTVRSGAVLDCGANETVLERASVANVSIVVPLSLSGVELGPNPLAPGGTANLEGTVTGGEPPYALDVTWGDGDHSTVALPAPGLFSVGHRFSAGEFVPSVIASDAGGSFVNVSVPEPLSVGTGFEVAIAPASYVAELGVPTEFSGIAQDEPTGAVTLFDCSNATVGPGVASNATPNGTAFSCTFTASGTAEVLFGVYPPEPGGPSASVILYERVVAPPQVSAELAEPVGEVGNTELVPVRLSGGALPVLLTWNISGNRSGGTETVDSDGGGVLALPLGAAGEYVLGLRASDVLGGVGTNSTTTVRVESPLVANASGAESFASYGAIAQVAGEVLSGCPPFSWWVVPGFTPVNGSTGNGTLPNVGAFAWSGWYRPGREPLGHGGSGRRVRRNLADGTWGSARPSPFGRGHGRPGTDLAQRNARGQRVGSGRTAALPTGRERERQRILEPDGPLGRDVPLADTHGRERVGGGRGLRDGPPGRICGDQSNGRHDPSVGPGRPAPRPFSTTLGDLRTVRQLDDTVHDRPDLALGVSRYVRGRRDIGAPMAAPGSTATHRGPRTRPRGDPQAHH